MDHTRLCVTVMAPTMEVLRARRDALAGADLVELRLDAVDRPDVRGALEGRRAPVLVTCRPTWEGGLYAGPEDERLRLLTEALELGAEFVDVEWRALPPEFATSGHCDRLVVSMHDFSGVPPDLADRTAAMRRTGARVVKIAALAGSLAETLAILEHGRQNSASTVALAMGEAGLASRVLAGRFGFPWTYAADTVAAAPGQLSLARMRDEFRADAVTAATAVYGVVGKPVSHSLSPAMHNAAFRATGLDAVYLPLAAADFDDFRQFAEQVDLRGASVTAPFKVDAFSFAGASDEDGREAEAVNTLRYADGRWLGRNTDAEGFMAPLRKHHAVHNRRATILGAGGAARAVALKLRQAGAQVTVVARREDAAAALARRAGVHCAPWPPRAGSWDLLVNATPVGTAPHGDQSPLSADCLDGQLVYDLVYNPPRTRLLEEARARGCTVLDGLDMLVAQAAAQFTWWTGIPAPDAAMREAALAALAAQSPTDRAGAGAARRSADQS